MSLAPAPTIAHHVLLELFGCRPSATDDPDGVRGALHAAAAALRTPVLGEAYHRFSPQGVSGVVLIAESHLSVHTWPEAGYVAADVYTCGEIHPEEALPVLAGAFGATSWVAADVVRGLVELAPSAPRLEARVLVGSSARPLARDADGAPILDGRFHLLRAHGVVDVTGIADDLHGSAVREEAIGSAGRGERASARLQHLCEDARLRARLSVVMGRPVVAGACEVQVQGASATAWTPCPGGLLLWVVADAGGGGLEVDDGELVRRHPLGLGRMVLLRRGIRFRATAGAGRRVTVALPLVG